MSESLRDAKAEIKAEIARTDTKASLLLAFDGVALAGIWTLGSQPWVPLTAQVVGGLAAVALLASITVLLRTVRPRIGYRGHAVGFPRWAELTAAELAEELATDRTADHVVVLAGIVAAKMRGIQRAVDATLTSGALLILAAVITVGGVA